MTPPDHQDRVAARMARIAALQNGTPSTPPPAVQAPPVVEVPAARQDSDAEAVPAIQEAAPATTAPEAAKAPVQPKPKPKTKAKPETSSQEVPASGGRKLRIPVLMDRDLLGLIGLAQAARGLTIAQVYTAAAREYRLVAADLSSTPLATTVIDDLYDEVVTESAHRTMLSPYMTKRACAQLDADAASCGLDRSEFVRRVVRAYLTIDKVFVPESKEHLLTEEYLGPVLEELKVQVASGRPAAVLPDAAGQRWTMVRLPEGSPLRALADEARDAMRGCTSATQALLTVL